MFKSGDYYKRIYAYQKKIKNPYQQSLKKLLNKFNCVDKEINNKKKQ